MTGEVGIREELEREWAAGDAFTDRLIAFVEAAPDAAVRELARLVLDDFRFFSDHLPEYREQVAPFKCSGETYHYCSFSAIHDPGCRAVGGDGTLHNSYAAASSCEPDCGETDAKPWCQSSGFDCSTCALVDSLLGILAREPT